VAELERGNKVFYDFYPIFGEVFRVYLLLLFDEYLRAMKFS